VASKEEQAGNPPSHPAAAGHDELPPGGSSPPKFSPLWWRSDLPEAVQHRCAHLVVSLLIERAKGIYRWTGTEEPDEPAIRHYVIEHDSEAWFTCRNVVMLRDWVRVYPEQMNKVAKQALAADDLEVVKYQAKWLKNAPENSKPT
jgi:hypothetical protein